MALCRQTLFHLSYITNAPPHYLYKLSFAYMPLPSLSILYPLEQIPPPSFHCSLPFLPHPLSLWGKYISKFLS